MTHLTTLFDFDYSARARRTDPLPSKIAAESLSSTHLEELERRIVSFLREQGSEGATSFEISEGIGVQYSSITPRIKPLREKGLIDKSGRTRKAAGKVVGSTVWVALPHSMREAA